MAEPRQEKRFTPFDLANPGVGSQSQGKTTAKKWQFGIAVPVANRRFEAGKALSYKVNRDDFDSSRVQSQANQIGLITPNNTLDKAPSKNIQYGDRAYIGPSSERVDRSRSEPIKLAGAKDSLEPSRRWTQGILYLLDRDNQYAYLNGDPITVYATGCAAKWFARDQRCHPLGTHKGFSSLNNLGLYSAQDVEDVTVDTDQLGNDVLRIAVRLPANSSFDVSSAKGHTAIFNAKRALMPFRDPEYTSINRWDWLHQLTGDMGVLRYIEDRGNNEYVAHIVYNTSVLQTLDQFTIILDSSISTGLLALNLDNVASIGDVVAQGQRFYDLVIVSPPDQTETIELTDGQETVSVEVEPGPADTIASTIASAITSESGFAVRANAFAPNGEDFPSIVRLTNRDYSTPNIDDQEPTITPLLLGFYHPGGKYTDYGQAIMAMVNQDSLVVGDTRQTQTALSQILSHSRQWPYKDRHNLIMGGTYYRMGLRWKGEISPHDSALVEGSSFYAALQWAPLDKGSDHSNKYISTQELLNADFPYQSDWMESQVSGYIDQSMVDKFSRDGDQRIDLILKASSPTSWTNGRQDRGAEVLAFVDDVWLEHQGDLPNPTNLGYVEIDHFPEMSTLQVNTFFLGDSEDVELSHGEVQKLKSSTAGDRRRYRIECDFMNIPLKDFEKFQGLLKWQERGHLISIHPFLPDVPHCLVGRMELTNVRKNFWDLNRFSLRFIFREV